VKRVVLFMFVVLLAFSVTTAFAGDGCSKEAKKSCAKACASKAKGDGEAKEAKTDVEAKVAPCPHSTKQAAAEGETEAKAEAHVCPDVTERTALKEFHTAMHPMHVSLGEEDFAAVRTGMPNLMATTKAVGEFNCDGYDKCSDACKTNFDGKKAELINAVKVLAKACKGDDNEQVSKSFDTMHEAYITFAKTCVHPEKTDVKAEEKKETY